MKSNKPNERLVVWTTQELPTGEVVERRDGKDEVWSTSMYPRQKHKAVSLLRPIVDACCLSFRIVRDLIVVSFKGSVDAELVGAAGTEDQVSKATDAASFIMQHLRPRCCEAVIFAESV